MRAKRILSLVFAALLAISLALPAALLAEGRKGQVVKFSGVAQQIDVPEGAEALSAWRVDGQTVLVTTETNLVTSHGPLEDGAEVMVIGRQEGEDAPVIAIVLRLLKQKTPRTSKVFVRGVISEMDVSDDGEGHMVGSIVIEGVTILVTADTLVEGELAVGAYVIVRGIAVPEGVQAEYIHVREPEEEQEEIVEFWGEIVAIGNDDTGDYYDIRVGDEDDDEEENDVRRVYVNEETNLPESPLGIGDMVRVRAREAEGGTLWAIAIGRIEPDGFVPELVSFSGPIQRFAAGLEGRWLIAGVHVVVTDREIVEGEPRVGYEAEVEGLRYRNGLVHATRVVIIPPTVEPEPDEITFSGAVLDMPPHRNGTWTVDTWRFIVNSKTVVSDTIALGDMVQVTAVQAGRGMLFAKSVIKIVAPTETPEPTEEATVTPTDEATPEITETAEVEEPTPSSTPHRPKPTKTPKPPRPHGARGGYVY
ncbi:MAG: hypothetical protein H5T69_03030 [Chloroflexi bacterium]|nr:hypothetical protein [Chloroflexota bacterium]